MLLLSEEPEDGQVSQDGGAVKGHKFLIAVRFIRGVTEFAFKSFSHIIDLYEQSAQSRSRGSTVD